MNRGTRLAASSALPGVIVSFMLLLGAAAASAQDPENCLSCHRFRGLSRLDPETGELRLFFASAEYYIHRQGAHARLRCTDCHRREEVQVIPHRVKTPVDCATTCHITPAATGSALRFSHQPVEDSIARSVHAPDKLTGLFEPPLLRPGQSNCLYCHDQPVYGFEHGLPEGFIDHSGGTRCDTCHEEVLPLEIDYFAKHVAARMKPARPVRQLAQVCAVCHSEERIVEQFNGHDPVASYLHSFHGKASLLGSKETATCVACHSSPSGNPHLMLPADDPESSINPVQLSDTCRTTRCHPGSPPQMSHAAVHLRLDPERRTPEWFVAAFFILMTATVMAIFFVLVILELLNTAVRRPDPEQHRLARLANMLRANPRGRELLQRMTVHQRWQHWVLVISFALLACTGMPIKFAEAEWAHWFVQAFGGLAFARWIHRVAGVVLIAIFLYHIAYLMTKLVQQIRDDRRAGVSVPLWKRLLFSPMMLTPGDAVQFLQLMGYLLGLRKQRPRFGKYNFAEKFEYWAVFWGVPVMGLSGLALWYMPWVTELLSGRVINFAFIIHSDEAYLAFIYIAAIHLFSVIFAPAVFPVSLGSLSGQAPDEEWAENHQAELERIAAEIDVVVPKEVDRGEGRSLLGRLIGGVLKHGYSLAAAAAYGGVAYVSLHFLLTMLLTRQTAPVEITDIPKRLDADQFVQAAADPVAHSANLEHRARGPLAHFHQIPQWFQPDPLDTCTTSGCHNPLPHGQRIELRAFLNMHTTFVDCMVCHTQAPPTDTTPRWFSLPSREPRDAPAILQLATRLAELDEDVAPEAAAVSAQLLALLREALPASGNDAQLADWLLRLEITYPGSRVWRGLLAEMRERIHLHVRGEYAAKIGLYTQSERVGAPTAEQRAAAQRYLAPSPSLSEAEQRDALDVIHAGVAPTGAMCTPCHSESPSLLDIGQLGYPAARVTTLEHSQIMRSVLTIESGQPFYLPLEAPPTPDQHP